MRQFKLNREEEPCENPFFNHFIKFNNITDEEIESMASEGGGLDAEYCLLLYLERDFVQSFNKELQKLL